ncbi:MAG: 3-hydroxyacyl-CoA dehydrogenase/enoyl-CoA hydratase family protein [Candidatus Thalassarchaeaceae archaeon]|jgi:enoyl-CoA hydratase/3-hydroxyacyl-CoA dehydrogenase|nr:hypothetical protein [Euryarchaeota archaeon]MDP7256821.1 3-hydroxyacyl-CoA dehydrogenase/enoyl-CoA hydratase family protein [Candidatus Thalassarchaeaceae archaeon]HJO84066.1 3-hydroxyacyl-CoA dehydrogenase/enoyl-CoA hydratase family protein [Candidatus Thalassarchaeaceae archaeon]|tara:strand:+ start:28240 stop:30252 length:2013 start_codon:yes stop_codon:yes gene_type:complete
MHPTKWLGTVGVVGSGQIGPDIALHFAKALVDQSSRVIVQDIDASALERGREKIERKLDMGVKSGAFRQAAVDKMLASLHFTEDVTELAGADLVIEAATEEVGIKHRIMARLGELLSPNAVLASNSSHLTPEEIFSATPHPERCLVIHYFFPAERNRVVELVPHPNFAEEALQRLLSMYETIGKVPFRVNSRYGYAIDPIFEGLVQVATELVASGMGEPRQVDRLACEALGLVVGPFTAMNLTGGNPITAKGLARMGSEISPWYKPPALLDQMVASGERWDTAKRGETVDLSAKQRDAVLPLFHGAYLALCGEIIDAGVLSASDLESGIEIALVIDSPQTIFRRLSADGVEQAMRLAENRWPDLPRARCIREWIASGTAPPPSYVHSRCEGEFAIITIRRPLQLNALNELVLEQLEKALNTAQTDPLVRAVVLTGFGTKAFVSGADIDMLAGLESREGAEAISRRTQAAFHAIASGPKPVVALLNGLAFGGGLELALACTARLAPVGLPLLAAAPETNLGIIPGAGGTQRLPRLIGLGPALEMMRTGRVMSAEDALASGLVDGLVEQPFLPSAFTHLEALLGQKTRANHLPTEPQQPTAFDVEIDIGHRSRLIDKILVRTVEDGWKMSLAEGLELEVSAFGDCYETEDMHIGLENFLQHGPRSPAEFCHK